MELESLRGKIGELALLVEPVRQLVEHPNFVWTLLMVLFYALWLAVKELRVTRERLVDLQGKYATLRRLEKGAATKTASQPAATEAPADTIDQLEFQPREEGLAPVAATPEVVVEHLTVKRSTSAVVPGEISAGLEKTRTKFFSGLKNLFSRKSNDREALFNELEELLVTSDLGIGTTKRLLESCRNDAAALEDFSFDALKGSLKQCIFSILVDSNDPIIEPKQVSGKPKVVMVVGVNGVGKTTTVGKLAAQFRVQGARVLVGACDTFRAAAGEQLEEWARRADVEIVQGAENAKPSTVAFQTIERGLAEAFDVILLDTAGRLHTKVNLMNELEHVVKIVERELPGAPHETILVLDATTGQNAVQQAREFNERAKLTGVIVTKLDGTPKGGVVVAIKDELKTPVRYIGIGEGIGDLRPFVAEEFVAALFDEGTLVDDGREASEHGETRRRKRRQAY